MSKRRGRPRDEGIRITPIPVRSVASVFEKRGNPLGEPRRKILTVSPLSDTEKIADQIRTILGKTTQRSFEQALEDLGNPEMDSFTKAMMRPERKELPPDKPIKPRDEFPNLRRKLTNIQVRLRRQFKENERLIVIKDNQGMNLAEAKAVDHFKDQIRITTAEERRKEKKFQSGEE